MGPAQIIFIRSHPDALLDGDCQLPSCSVFKSSLRLCLLPTRRTSRTSGATRTRTCPYASTCEAGILQNSALTRRKGIANNSRYSRRRDFAMANGNPLLSIARARLDSLDFGLWTLSSSAGG
eukprot:scaffold155778_cov17-Prasinocladus_malaysianus.AAC.1